MSSIATICSLNGQVKVLLLKQQADGLYIVCEVERSVPSKELLDLTQRLAGHVHSSMAMLLRLRKASSQYQGHLAFIQPMIFKHSSDLTLAGVSGELLRLLRMSLPLPPSASPSLTPATSDFNPCWCNSRHDHLCCSSPCYHPHADNACCTACRDAILWLSRSRRIHNVQDVVWCVEPCIRSLKPSQTSSRPESVTTPKNVRVLHSIFTHFLLCKLNQSHVVVPMMMMMTRAHHHHHHHQAKLGASQMWIAQQNKRQRTKWRCRVCVVQTAAARRRAHLRRVRSSL